MNRTGFLVLLCALCALLIFGIVSAGSKKSSSTAKVVESKSATSSPKKAVSVKKRESTSNSKKASTSTATGEKLKPQTTTNQEIQTVAQPASAAPAAGEEINWQVIPGGGGVGASTNFGLISVVGQTAVGFGSSTNYQVNHGFLQEFIVSSGCCDTPGDFNDDGTFNIADVTGGIAYIFSGGTIYGCAQEADFNGDGTFNIADVTAGIAYIFSGGPAPICGP